MRGRREGREGERGRDNGVREGGRERERENGVREEMGERGRENGGREGMEGEGCDVSIDNIAQK